MNFDVIVLAGGFGTRLQSVVSDVPKPMAPINGKPFLHYLLQSITKHNPSKIILAVGYKHESIINYFGNNFNDIPIEYVIETSPLGTGGAIKSAFTKVDAKLALVLNGDTFFDINISDVIQFHEKEDTDITICLRHIDNAARYGTVLLNGDRIIHFNEKTELAEEGDINAGIYLFNTNCFIKENLPEVFSIEKDFFEKQIENFKIRGFVSSAYFIDIGIPDDYKRAQHDFAAFKY